MAGQGPRGERSAEKLASADRERAWHPYAPMPGTMAPLPVASASGVRLRLASGDELVCLTELAPHNLKPIARRLFMQGLAR